MEIEMVEMGCEKAADPPEFTTLASGLLKDYDKLDANKHILNRKTDRLTKSTIGNKTMLPQQVRVRVKAKAADDARMCAYIEQETITDLDLFKEVEASKDCLLRIFSQRQRTVLKEGLLQIRHSIFWVAVFLFAGNIYY